MHRASKSGLRWLGTVLGLALGAGCFSPQLSNRGFACDPTAPKPCPDGYRCIAGLCDNGMGGGPPGQPPGTGGDMAAGTGGNGGDDLAMSMPDDLAKSTQDLSSISPPLPDMTTPPPDLAKPPQDMARKPPDLAGTCQQTGGPCTTDWDCCGLLLCDFDNTCF